MSKLNDKTLTPAEQVRLREFVQEVWTTAYYDYDGVTGCLGEEAEIMAEILGFKLITRTPSGEDLDDDEFPE